MPRLKYGLEIAIEFFFEYKKNCFLILPTENERNKIYKFVVSKFSKLELMKDHFEIVEKGDKKIGSRIKSLIKTNYTKQWENGEISNFDYLLKLNNLSGRTFNDITQYPVFPWILQDYTSETLDLNDTNTYRDLSKPMGALSKERFNSFSVNYNNWTDKKIPAFHYGSHYSSSAIVLHYLVRIEPFTSHYVQLHGGKFDNPARLFQSINFSYEMSSKISLTSVKELIPEFFYLPELLLNLNNFNLGKVNSTGKMVNNVELPKWSNQCIHTFLYLHRKALESDYVSEHLNEWIDLIFGYKQKGSEAIKAGNTFYYLSYEGNVQLKEYSDLNEQNAVLLHVDSFGQTPTQLFTKAHPPKKTQSIRNNKISQNYFWSHPEHLQSFQFKQLKTEIGDFQTVSQNSMDIQYVNKNEMLIPPTYEYKLSWSYPDESFRIISNYKLCTAREFPHFPGKITAVSISENGRWVISGGEDQIINLWKFKSKLIKKTKNKITKLKLDQKLYGHNSIITCLDICSKFGFFVSASQNGSCIIWDLNKKNPTKYFPFFKNNVSIITINQSNGDIILSTGLDLRVYTLNGLLICEKVIEKSKGNIISCIQTVNINNSSHDYLIITGQMKGKIRFWRMKVKNKKIKISQVWKGEFHESSPISLIKVSKDKSKLFYSNNTGIHFLSSLELQRKSKTNNNQLKSETYCNICKSQLISKEKIRICVKCNHKICNKCSSVYKNRNIKFDPNINYICNDCVKINQNIHQKKLIDKNSNEKLSKSKK
ncbi:beige/beach-related [Anaeramoeba flamelloides]|uniref:Beige/beach-related n=1 Tax=Anaeramoeba flamelloides TaxID=1746091 RepID=A0AAV7YAY4_9EUKA|nr:beige/beach-related [Anaeramoeba flamelloides]